MRYLELPWQSVPSDTLHNLLEEWCSRDGTDYGEREVPLAARVQQLVTALRQKQVVLVYDQDSQSHAVMSLEQWRHLQSDQ